MRRLLTCAKGIAVKHVALGLLAGGLLAYAAAGAGRAQPAAPAGWTLVVLGIAQDGGIPHLGCRQTLCVEARAGRRPAEKVSAIGLVDEAGRTAYLFDATPDFRAQVHALTGGRLPDGIFLTHAHIGHYTGLMYLGKESVAAKGVPVYGTGRMAEFLRANAPWKLLVSDGHIALRPIEPDRPIALAPSLTVTALPVPHREEFTDTVGYLIEGPRAKALYIPDIDGWDRWDRSLRELADRVDLMFLDGTFSSPADLGLRDYRAIPHPMMPVTRALVRGARGRLWFIHLNHTNPELLSGTDVAREGMRFPL
jgi:pyrroloquinoline quinone biosynthesis protein B